MKFVYILLLGIGFSLPSIAQTYESPVTLQKKEVSGILGARVGHFGRIYYECDSVEDDVEEFLEALGATNVRVHCSGGLDTINPRFTTPASFRATYTAYAIDPASTDVRTYSEVNLRGRDNCALIAELFHIFEGELAIMDIEGRGSRVSSLCGSSDSYNVTLKVVK